MPHFTTLIEQTCLGAINFTNDDMTPRELPLTIKDVTSDKPPGGGKQRICLYFRETEKKAFFATGQIKKLANLLMCANTENWIGARIMVTCGKVKSPKGGETMGMIITKAARPKGAASVPLAPAQPDERLEAMPQEPTSD